MERLEFGKTAYQAIEGAIHINRYLLVKDLVKNKKVLDIACGEGYGSYLISKWGASEVTGIDISSEAINKAKSNFQLENIDFKVSNAEELSEIKDNSFDLIVSFETIEHLENPSKFLEELKRISKKDSTFIISCPNDYFYYPEEDKFNPYHKKKYTFTEFENLTSLILGKNAKFLICTYLNGYVNLKLEGKSRSKAKEEQKDMLSFNNINTVILPPDTEINEKNSCYFVGVWNGNIDECATIYPYSYNPLMIQISELVSENKMLSNSNNKLKLMSNSERNSDEIDLELQKYKSIVESLEKENHLLKENISNITHFNGRRSIFYRAARKVYRILRSIIRKIKNIIRKMLGCAK